MAGGGRGELTDVTDHRALENDRGRSPWMESGGSVWLQGGAVMTEDGENMASDGERH
jgi:hypothetical protein